LIQGKIRYHIREETIDVESGESLCISPNTPPTWLNFSASAIAWCQTRFPDSTAQYIVADVLHPPEFWQRSFDTVLESYTLQVLPPPLRQTAMQHIANFVE
jgi:hypothetical protein